MSEALDRGLPHNLDAERMVLGSIMLSGELYVSAAATLLPEDFGIEKHRLIFEAMSAVYEAAGKIDRVTVANELMRRGRLESCDGLGYLVSLDDGLPQIANVDSYVAIVKDKATLRKICFAGHAITSRACGESSPDEVLAYSSRLLVELTERQTKTTLRTPGAIIESAGGVNVYLDRKNRTTGLKTGFSDLDTLTGGWKKGNLYVLAARPSMGKTALALNLAEHVALKCGEIVLIFSLEMGEESLLDRMICSRARVDTARFDGGFVNSDDRASLMRATGEIAEGDRILIDDKAVTGVHEIHSKIRKRQVAGPVGLVIVDYLQLMAGGGSIEHRVSEVSAISRGMKLIAKDCKVPMLVLSQLSRAVEARTDHRPQLSDLRESGSIEQDADVVAFIFREEVYRPLDEGLRGLADLILAKQRNGPTGTIPLTWQKQIVRFQQRAVAV